jgi:hypothetical protein
MALKYSEVKHWVFGPSKGLIFRSHLSLSGIGKKKKRERNMHSRSSSCGRDRRALGSYQGKFINKAIPAGLNQVGPTIEPSILRSEREIFSIYAKCVQIEVRIKNNTASRQRRCSKPGGTSGKCQREREHVVNVEPKSERLCIVWCVL